MKNPDLKESPDKDPEKEIGFSVDRDIFGILPVREWTCLQLDVFGDLAKRLGKNGIKLFYWLSQHKEANATMRSHPKGNIEWEVVRGMLQDLSQSSAREINQVVKKLRP